MLNTLLMTQEQVNLFVPANDTLNTFEVNAAILQAQDVQIKPVTGREWFEELQQQIEDDTLTPANEAALPYIQKALAYAAVVKLRDNLLDSMTNTGINVISTPWETSTEKDRFDMKSRGYAQSSNQAIEDLKHFLRAHIDNYPLYKAEVYKRDSTHAKGWFA
jgi:hypothetical protein